MKKIKKKSSLKKPQPPKILISTPSMGLINSETSMNLINLVSYSMSLGYILGAISPKGSLIATSRCNCVEIALKNNMDYILFIDSDMKFPPTSLQRLLKHNVDIVGCNASKKIDGDFIDVAVIAENLDGEYLDEVEEEITMVDSIGMAVTLIKTEVFKNINKPYFYVGFQEGTNTQIGEDIVFCLTAREAGYDVWCDVELSKEIGHIGYKEFKLPKY